MSSVGKRNLSIIAGICFLITALISSSFSKIAVITNTIVSIVCFIRAYKACKS